ncbi:MAG: DUF255 domain-containing protein [Bacteroidota bacterium]
MQQLAYGCLLLVALLTADVTTNPPAEATIEWLSWGEALQRQQTAPKKIFIDIYTDWCGWCKRMDATTFVDADVVKAMNANFYAVKLDAEMRELIQYDNHTFKYQAQGRRGFHELAYALLDGRMSYPSFVYLDENRQRISISPGYKDAAGMEVELRYVGEDHFATQSFEDFKAQGEE